jgi:hypothetical protein
MLFPRPVRAASLTAAALLALTACNSSTSPSTTSTPQPANISGDYSGTVQDAQAGSGSATGTLAQHGTSAGGAITFTPNSGSLTAQMSLSINASNAISGAIVIDYPNGTTCTFGTTGSYDTNTNVLSGSYSAKTNCSGDTGTYNLTQQCTDTVTSSLRRRLSPPAAC